MTPICLCLEGASLKARHTFITTHEAMVASTPQHHLSGSQDPETGPASGSIHEEGDADCDLSRSWSEETADLWVQDERHHLYERGIFKTIAKRTGASSEFSVCQN